MPNSLAVFPSLVCPDYCNVFQLRRLWCCFIPNGWNLCLLRSLLLVCLSEHRIVIVTHMRCCHCWFGAVRIRKRCSWGSRVASDTINDDETSQSGVELWALAKHRFSENSIQLGFPRYASLRNDLFVEHGREAPEPSQPLRRPGKAQERNKAEEWR